MGKLPEDRQNVYLVDFGLAKEHLDMNTSKPFQPRRNTDFRGTIPYASLTAHLKKELGRKDDLWSFFFVILEFLDEPLSWKTNTCKDSVRDCKTKAFNKPQKYLFPNLQLRYP
jgi:tau tubulin kinase